jgi:phage FluMu protein Com
MADERYVVMTVECPRCKTKQKVHVAARTGGAQMGDQTIRCIKCDKDFDVMVTDKILRGPFPA